jgi:glycosyltransferase involved in cell wall biosynthesis
MEWIALILLIPYIFLILKIYMSLRKIQPYNPHKTSDVFVSVIVACRNEEKNLLSLLSDIAAQDYNPGLFEVIIIDDNSSDSTNKIASGFTGIKNFKILRNPGAGKKKSIKAGIEACIGELVITTDADCRMGIKWMKTISLFYSEHRPQMILGPVDIEGTKGFFNRFQELEFLSLQGVTAGTAVDRNPVMCNGANLAFTKEVYNLNSANLHEEEVSGDDIFLLHSVKEKNGNKILWLESPDALVTSETSKTLSSFLQQRARWISKTGSYNDRYTQILAIVTFVTILLELFILISVFFNPVFLIVLLAVFLLKSLPDFLILRNTAIRYKKKNLLWFFLPAQLVYPLYVILVLIYYLRKRSKYFKTPEII